MIAACEWILLHWNGLRSEWNVLVSLGATVLEEGWDEVTRALEAPPACGFSLGSALRASAAMVLLVFGLGADASGLPLTSGNSFPIGSRVAVLPRGQREVTVSWTLRAKSAGTRVILHAGPAVGFGLPLAEKTTVAPGLNTFDFVDRTEHEGQWTYWLVVVDDHGRGSVLGALVCISHGMNEGSAPARKASADPVLWEWPAVERDPCRQALAEMLIVEDDLFLEAPPAPPPEGRGVS